MLKGGKLARIRFALRIAKVKPRHVLYPFVMSLAAAALGAIGFGLVVPLASGLATRSFAFATKLPLIGKLLGRFTGTASLPAAFLVLVGAIVICSLISIVLKYVAGRYLVWRNGYLDENIKAHLLQRILTLSRRFFDERNQGRMTRLFGLSGSIVSLIGSAQNMLASGAQLGARMVLIFLLSWRMALCVGVGLFLLDRVLGSVRKHLKKLSRASADVQRDLTRQLFNMFASIDLVKATAREDAIEARYRAQRAELRRLERRADLLSGLTNPIQDSARLLTLAALVVVVMATVGLENTERMAELLVMFWVGQSALPYFNELANSRMTLIRTLPDADELIKVLEESQAYVVASGDKIFTGLTAAIELRGLTFRYRDDDPQPALRGLDLTIPRGKVTGIAGATGAGKSTIAKLLVRLYDCPPGQILVDGTDIRELSLSSVRGELVYVGQQVVLFDDTVRENVTFGASPAPTDDEIWDALRRVDLHETISRRPEGLDTRLGDHGLTLSGGERQRMAIARALLRRAPILILDEATSALDALTERKVMTEIVTSRPGVTLLVIAHRLTTIREADNIAYLERGSVVEQGTFAELIAREGHFHAAWRVLESGPSGRAAEVDA